jgi:hypothetical protein
MNVLLEVIKIFKEIMKEKPGPLNQGNHYIISNIYATSIVIQIIKFENYWIIQRWVRSTLLKLYRLIIMIFPEGNGCGKK